MKNEFIISIPQYEGIGIYALVNNQTGKMYIGSSQNIRQRIMQHRYSPPAAIKDDIQKGSTFSVKILEKLPYGCNQFDLFGRVSYFIQQYDTLNSGYNRAKTTCSTKQELLHALESFKDSEQMSAYIKNIIHKRERPIYPKVQSQNDLRHIAIDPSLFSAAQEHAKKMGESMNAFVVRALNETMVRDTE